MVKGDAVHLRVWFLQLQNISVG
uniref:Uncharacterized protein n=1 Tax=Anopheles minimus TaxID=112268 RepID=A0A182WP01_9DIPT